ncbi:MAG: hypothetical protein QY309_06015 [Cyclobacteriaceae bacterium]|nr:MAG: hypothetical protein QY309_06015 [Cyclobacteriaceae bacterium]
MNRILGLVFLFSSTICVYSQDNTLADFGIEIIFSADHKIFPEAWLTEEINGRATPLDTGEFKRSKAIITKALNKYPVELIRKHLTKIYVVGQLEFYGQEYGGTNSISEIYLSNGGSNLGYTDFWIEQAFHSEFSSILLRNYSFLFDKKKWISQNKGIHYGKSGTDALKHGKASETFDLELNKKGVLSLYSTASIEEDFNSFAENLFKSNTGFWEIVKMHKRIREKTSQIIEFYHRLDGRFDEKYFKSVSQK